MILGLIGLFKSRKNKNEEMERLRTGVLYFVNGSEVMFDLKGMDFTFEGFYLSFDKDGLYLRVRSEAPMNLILIHDVVVDDIGVERKLVLDSDEVNFILALHAELFNRVKDNILELTDARDIFDLEIEGRKLLRLLESYRLIEYGTSTTTIETEIGGRIGNALKR